MAEAATIENCDTCNGTLTLASSTSFAGSMAQVNLMNGFAFCVYDSSDLWKLEVRGDNRVVPGLDGEQAYVKKLDPVVMQLPMVVVGAYTVAGALNADPAAGLAVNLAYLRTNLEYPVSTGSGTRLATWVDENGTTRTAQVQVIPPLQHKIGVGHMARLVLTLRVPGGRFS